MAYYDLREWISALDRRRRTDPHQSRSRPHPGDRRNHRPRLQVGTARQPRPRRAGAAVRERQGLSRLEGAHQPVRLRAPHENGARRRLARRNCRPHQDVHGREVAAGVARQNQDAAHAGRDGQVLPQRSLDRPVQRSDQARQLLAARFPHPAMLAARRRTLHHAAVGHHQRPEDRQAQRRHLSHADLRRAHRRHALAAPEAAAPSTIASRCAAPQPRARLILSAPRST